MVHYNFFLKKTIFKPLHFSLILLLIIPDTNPAQLILPSVTGTFDRYPNFNFEWIKKNNIEEITFDILDKKDYKPGKDEGIIEKYEFDKEGKLTRFYFTEVAKQTLKETYVPLVKKRRYHYGGYTKREKVYEYDTILTRFYYDEKGRLKLTRYNEGTYYESIYYDYDNEDRIIRELRCKETNLTHGSGVFTLGVQNIISDEKFEYQKTGAKQVKKKCLNDEGRVFREIIINSNEKDKITEMNENFTVAWISQKTRFWYNDFDQLVQKTFESNADGSQAIRDTFEYDNKGNILWERQYMNGILLNERSYIFDPNSSLVNSFVIRNHTEKSMRITKLIYDFRKPE